MPFTGDFDKFKKLARSVERLADPNGKPQQRIAREVIREVRAGPLRDQYQSGVGSDGPWEPRKDGKPALVSRKLPTVIRGRPVVGGAEFEWRSKIMRAHHEGHVFPPRRGGGHSVFFDESNRAIRMGRLTRRAFRYTFVREVVVQGHDIRARVLPARRQYPGPNRMPAPWATAIKTGMRRGMQRWGADATR